jgi:hypothetical protein
MRTGQLHVLLLSVMINCLIVSIAACNNQNDTGTGMETSTTAPPQTQLVYDKLIGVWRSEDGKSFEQWIKKNNGNYQSVAFSVKGNDTSWNEQADIYPENEKWVFENTVKGQNDGKAVKFLSLFVNDTSVQFNNPVHDFPTDVNYTVTGHDKVNAFIIGPGSKGGKDTILFNYIRVN